MADNTQLNVGTGGDVVASDDVQTLNGQASSGVKVERTKVTFGGPKSASDVSASNPLPTADGGLGTDGATPPALAGSGVRGWLRAIYERLSSGLQVTVTNPASGGATEGTLAAARQDLDTLAGKDVATAARQDTQTTVLGASGGTAPPSGSGVMGWLRGILDKLNGTLDVGDRSGRLLGHVTIDNPSATDVSTLARDATLSTAAGGPGSSPPALTGNGSGILGYLRGVLDALRGTLTVGGTVSVGNLPATQPVSATGLPLPAGASTEATLAAAKADLDAVSAAAGAQADAASANTIIGRLKTIAGALAGTLTTDVSDRAGRLLGTTTPLKSGDQASTLTDGRKVVATAGTRVALTTSSTCKWVTLTALHSNTDVVMVGGTGVIAALATRAGISLTAGQATTIPVDDPSKINVDAMVSGEGVLFLVGS